MSTIVEKISDNMAIFDQHIERATKAADFVDILFDDNLPFMRKWEEETMTIGGVDVESFDRYCRGEDLLDGIYEEIETEYNG